MSDPTRRRFLTQAHNSLAAAPVLALGPAFAQPLATQPSQTGWAPGGRVAAEAFGAVGDGQKNDGPALQSAIDALERSGGGILFLGNKRYRIDQTLDVDPTRVSISGAHTILDCRSLPAASAAILVRSRPRSPQYDQATQFIEGIIIQGPGAPARTTGIALRTGTTALSSRFVLRNLVIKDAAIGIDFGARTYLCQSYSLQIYGTGTGVAFTSSEDAGENISFYGCTIFNSELAVENRSGAFANFLGCSFDYCRRWFLGQGLNQFTNCWFEKHRPERDEDYPFDLLAGELLFVGGGIQISGIDFEKGSQNRYMFMTRDKLARVSLHGTTAWNWRTATDELAGGPGSIAIRGLGGTGNKILPTVLKNDRRHNVFGAAGEFEEPSVRIPCWIEGEGATRLNANELEWRDGASVYAKGSASIATDLARSGRQSLKISKGIGRGVPFSFNIATPIVAEEGFALRLWYWLRARPAGPLWFQVFFSQVLCTDQFGVPRIGNEQFWGETTVRPDDVTAEWRRISFNSHSLDATADVLGYAPAWATHVRVQISLVAVGGETDLWIDDLGGWRL